MKRVSLLLFSLAIAGCSGDGAIEPVLDVTGDSLAQDATPQDTQGHDQVLEDLLPDGQTMKDLAEDDLAPDAVADVQTDLGDLTDTQMLDIANDLQTDDVELVEDVQEETQEVDLMPVGPTCYEYVVCSQNSGCSGTGPCPACQDLLVGEVQAELGTLSSCIQTNCSGLEGQPFGECIWGTCGIQWLECIGGEGKGTCNDVLTCAAECDQFTDSECMQGCVSLADEEALEQVKNIFTDQQSEDQKFGYVADCVGGQGSGGCYEALTCMNACGEENPPCTVACLKDTSADALEKLKSMIGCDTEACFIPAIQCIGGGGTASCMDTLQCMNGCGEDPEGGCFAQCAAAASDLGTDQLVQFSACIQEKCNGQMQGCPAGQECLALCGN